MKKFLLYVVMVASLAVLGLVGCSSLVESVVPARVSLKALSYVGADANEYSPMLPYFSLTDAKELKRDVLITHRDIQFDYKTAIQKDKYAKSDSLKSVEQNIAESTQLLDTVMSGTQYLPGAPGLALAALGLTGGGMLIKRPGDKSKTEFNEAGRKKPEDFVEA